MILNFLYFNKLEEIEQDSPNDVVVVQRALRQIRTAPRETLTTIFVEDCGAALRFLLPILAITTGKWQLTGTKRLLQRPVNQLVIALQSIGAEIENGSDGLLINGKELSAEHLVVDARASSQFVTAILLISKKLGLKTMAFEGAFVPSFSYVQLTTEMLKSAGVGVKIDEHLARISQLKENEISLERWAESDWSSAAFWYAVAGLRNDLSFALDKLHVESAQGDRAAATIFNNFGVITTEHETGIIVAGRNCQLADNQHFNLKETPDLAPILCVFCALKAVNATICGLGTLNSKESRRLDLLEETLAQFVRVERVSDDELRIFGKERLPQHCAQTLHLNCHADHRLVIAFSLFSLFHDVQLTDTESVTKSYPNFFREWLPLFAKIRREK